MALKPLGDRIVVKSLEAQAKTKSGLVLPDTAKEKPQEGEVIAAGLGKYKEDGSRQALDVKAGDRVLFGKYSSSEIKVNGEELLIMCEDEILGIITRAGAAASSGSADESPMTPRWISDVTIAVWAGATSAARSSAMR